MAGMVGQPVTETFWSIKAYRQVRENSEEGTSEEGAGLLLEWQLAIFLGS